MKLTKAMAEALDEMFGPNPIKTTMVTTDTLRFRAFQELERIGLVRIRTPKRGESYYECLREVTRAMDRETLCEVFTRDAS